MALGLGYKSIWGGAIDEDYFKKEIDNAKNATEAQRALLLAMKDTVRGLTNVGVSAGDQRAVLRLIDYYGKKYNADTSVLKEMWSEDKDIKSGDIADLHKASEDHLFGHFSNGYQPNTYDGKKLKASGEKVVVNGKEQNVWNVGNTKHQVVWIGNGNNGGEYISLHEYHKRYTTKQDSDSSTNTDSTDTSGGGGSTSVNTDPKEVYTDNYKPLYEEAVKKLDEYLKPKPIGANKAAELYGIDYNEQNILNRKNEATNEYYDKAVAEQQNLRTNFARNNANYYDQVADSYVDSYKNAAPTATGQSALAANALSTMLSSGQTNSDNDYGMLQSIHGFEQDRAAELANNPLAARKEYNLLGTYLSQLSAQENAAAVKQYVADLDAYTSNYASDRMYQAYQAQAAANKYSGLAGAKIAKAGSSAGNLSDWEAMWNFYNAAGGADYASKKTNTILKDYVNSGGK